MATAVQLELIVDEKGAVQGVRGFDSSMKGLTGSVNQLDATLQKLNQHLAQTGQHAQGIRGIGEAAKVSNMEMVRLADETLGFRIPRAMQHVIAQSAVLSSALKGIGSGLIGLGAIEIGFSVGKGIYDGIKKVWDGYLSLTKAAADYQAQVEKAKEQDFVENIRSVETLTARWKEAHDAAQGYASATEIFKKMSWDQLAAGDVTGALTSRIISGKMSHLSTDSTAQADAIRKKSPEYIHQAQLNQIELNHALDKELQGRAKIAADEAAKRDRAAADRQYTEAREKQQGNTTPSDAGKTEQQAKDALAAKDAEAENFNLSREHGQELMKLREQALESGLRGTALYAAQEAAAIEELKGKDMDSAAARNAIHLRFHNDEMKRLQDQSRELEKMGSEAIASGMTGIAKIRFEGQSRVNAINGDTTHDAGYKAYAVAAANTETNNQVSNAQEEFTQRVDAIVAQNAARGVSGIAKIRADAERQIQALEADAKKGGFNPDEVDRGRGAILASSRDQQAELAARNGQETEQIEAQARIKSLSAEKQKTAAIQEEYNERLQKYREQLQQQEISQEDFNRRVTAAQQQMDAALADAAREAREKIAGELQGLFSAHPLEALQKMGEKFAGQAGAAVIQRVSSHAGGLPDTGSIFDKIAGVARNPDQRAEMAGKHGASAAGLISVQSATIHVMSANIVGGGGSSTRSLGFGGAGFSSGGSTAFSSGFAGGGGFGGTSPGMPSSPGGSTSGGVAGFSGVGGTSPGMPSSPGGGVGGVLNNIERGYGTMKDLSSLFHRGGGAGSASSTLANAAQPSGLETTDPQLTEAIGGGTLNADGSVTKSAFGSSMIGGGMTMSNTLGAAGAGLGLFSAAKTGGFGGMLGGAMSGAQLGMEVGGPIGAAIGAVGGAALGFFGGGEQARVWWLKNGRQRLSTDMDSFQQGGMDYLSAYGDMEQLKYTASETLKKMGFVGERYYHDTVTGEITQAEQKLSREQKAGRTAGTFSSAQYATGTDSVPAMLSPGERVIPTDQNERITRALESGAMHQSYRTAMQPSGVRTPAPVQSPTLQLHLHSQGSRDIFMAHANDLRAALTKSYSDYGGEADNVAT